MRTVTVGDFYFEPCSEPGHHFHVQAIGWVFEMTTEECDMTPEQLQKVVVQTMAAKISEIVGAKLQVEPENIDWTAIKAVNEFIGKISAVNSPPDRVQYWKNRVKVHPRIVIKRCPDSLMWYRDLVGQEVQVEHVDQDGLWAREPDGYINIIKFTDVE